MVDSKPPQRDNPEADEAISRLYRSAQDQDTAVIPEELDAAILAHARQAVTPEETGSTATRASQKRIVPLLRRWELPASVAATFVFASLLYLHNQDSVTPPLDTGTPRFDYAEPVSAPTTMAPTATAPDRSRAQQEKPAAPAPAENRAATAKADSTRAGPTPLLKKSVPAVTDQSGAARGLQQEQLAAPPALREPVRRDRMHDAPALQSAPAREEQLELRRPGDPTTFRSSAEMEAQPITIDAWLERITALWQGGDKALAQAELAEFKAHFPGHALDSLCLENSGLCEAE